MTREEAKELLPIIQAFAEGKTIQYRNSPFCNWEDVVSDGNYPFRNPSSYRIKPEPKYRPFKTQEECWAEMHKHSDLGWLRDIKNNNISQVLRIGDEVVDILGYTINTRTFEVMFQQFKFTDGTPFGIKEE